MKTVVVFCCLLAVVLATNTEFESFKVKFNRKYKTPIEEFFRKKIFLNNLMQINQHNQRFLEGKSTFTMDVNEFTDLTTQEFSEVMNTYQLETPDKNKILELPMVGANPVSKDYRTSGCITPVKNQKQCGSCWAFCVTGAAEYYNCIAKRQSPYPVGLSEQNLVDCTYVAPYYNRGCNGGVVGKAFEYIINNKGIDKEISYPYTAESKLNNCQYNALNKGGTLSSYQYVALNSEPQLETAVATYGPISVAIDASQQSFQNYKQGIYNDPLCSSTNLNHAVLVVGYGVENSVKYWLVKNSWGTSWGINGYIKMSKDKNNQCGIAAQPLFPTY